MGKPGRPKGTTKLNDEKIEEICGYIKQGNTYERSALLSDINECTFYDWRKHGKEDQKKGIDSVYSKFTKAIKKANRVFIAFHIQLLNNAAKEGDTKSSQWLLERKCHEEFGNKQTLVHQGGMDVTRFDIKLSPEEQALYLERLKRRYGEDIE